MRQGWLKRRETLVVTSLIILLLVYLLPVNAMTPVYDAANYQQNAAQTLKQIDQYARQVEQLRIQIKQYENMVTNTAAPAVYIFDRATAIIGEIKDTVEMLKNYKKTVKDIDAYLSKFKNLSTYRSSPCYSATGCTATEWKAMSEARAISSDVQKQTNDAMLKNATKQQEQIEKDAKTLERLQKSVEDARGQLLALQAANQLASMQIKQLMQIRTLLVTQQTALAAREQARIDDEARATAASERLYRVPKVNENYKMINKGF